MATTMNGLLSLPTELLAHISSFLFPDEALSFALSSRACAIGAADILCGLEKVFLEYRTIDDADPTKLLRTLRDIQFDDFRARCVRRIEIGELRSSWDDWKPTPIGNEQADLNPSIENLNLNAGESRDAQFQWREHYTYSELEEYRRLFRAHIFRNFTANTLSNEHVSMLRHGHDDPLKLLLIALSPRLETVVFYAFKPNEPSLIRNYAHPLSHSFLAHDQDIRQIFHSETRWFARSSPRENPWPPGFRSLKTVSICEPLPSEQPSQMYYTRPANVAGLFWLPNIQNIELRNVRHHRDGDEWVDIKIGCSSVRNLYFEACHIKVSTMLRFITAARALRKLTITKCGRDVGVVQDLVEGWYADSLGT